jgi:peptidoglycan hydrolase CwlO-like protein
MKVAMKKMSTTSNRRPLMNRIILVCLAFVLMVSAPIAYVQSALADQWDNQIRALQEQANQYQAQADQLRAHGDTLQQKLDGINAQLAALQAQIATNQAKHDKLQADIAVNQQKLSDSQDVLGEMLANLYVDDKVSSLELIASSKNIGDFVDKQEYRSSVRDQLNKTITEVRKIKKQLEDDKNAVEKILADLKAQNDQVAAVQAEQQNLVNQTRGEEAAYQSLVASARNSMLDIQAQQQAYYASLGGGGNAGVVGSFQYWGWSGNQGCGGGGYPYCGGQDTYADPWNLYNRECVSYVAWALENRFGKSVNAFHGDGNAMDWPSSAPRWSNAYRVGAPQRGDAVILPASGGFAPIGHAMIVESVGGDNVFVSQYNMYGNGQYSTMWIKTSGVIFLRFPPA